MATVKLADQPVKPERTRLKLVAEALDETIKKTATTRRNPIGSRAAAGRRQSQATPAC